MVLHEQEFLKKIIPKLSTKNLLQGNEDAIAFFTPKNESKDAFYTVINTDTIAWSSDALPKTMTYFQFGKKLVSVTLSDVIAKGAIPQYFLCSISVPMKMTEEELAELFDGIYSACNDYNIDYLGGDLGTSTELVLTGIVLGYSKENFLIKRANAKNNDVICTTGHFGYTGLGYKHYLSDEINITNENLLEKIDNKLLEPRARNDWLSYIQKYTNACIDSSDGLAISLQHLANESGKTVRLETLPVTPELNEYINLSKDQILDIVLFGGEEFELIFTLSEDNYKALVLELQADKNVKDLPIAIGHIQEGEPTIIYDNSIISIQNKGWNALQGFTK